MRLVQLVQMHRHDKTLDVSTVLGLCQQMMSFVAFKYLSIDPVAPALANATMNNVGNFT